MNARLFISLAAAAVASAAWAGITPSLPTDSLTTFSAAQTPSVALPDAEGNYSVDNLIKMVHTEHGYEAQGVTVTGGGIRIYAPDTSVSTDEADWSMTWFGLADFAVNPPLDHYLNPLYAVTSYSTYKDIPLPDGDYNIYYFDQLDNGQHYNLFTYEAVGETGQIGYPPYMYLINMANEGIEIPQSDAHDGVYEADVTLPAPDFKISFQRQGYWIPGFIFGPVNTASSALESNVKAPIEFGVNTWTPFTYSTAATVDDQLGEGEEAHVIIYFAGTTNYINVTRQGVTGVTDIATDDKTVTERYNLQGIPVSDDYSGLTIVRYSDGTSSLRRN